MKADDDFKVRESQKVRTKPIRLANCIEYGSVNDVENSRIAKTIDVLRAASPTESPELAAKTAVARNVAIPPQLLIRLDRDKRQKGSRYDSFLLAESASCLLSHHEIFSRDRWQSVSELYSGLPLMANEERSEEAEDFVRLFNRNVMRTIDELHGSV